MTRPTHCPVCYVSLGIRTKDTTALDTRLCDQHSAFAQVETKAKEEHQARGLKILLGQIALLEYLLADLRDKASKLENGK